jgi:hypothetical protein
MNGSFRTIKLLRSTPRANEIYMQYLWKSSICVCGFSGLRIQSSYQDVQGRIINLAISLPGSVSTVNTKRGINSSETREGCHIRFQQCCWLLPTSPWRRMGFKVLSWCTFCVGAAILNNSLLLPGDTELFPFHFVLWLASGSDCALQSNRHRMFIFRCDVYLLVSHRH